jgi:hypothetical protein
LADITFVDVLLAAACYQWTEKTFKLQNATEMSEIW